jgi:hypothetical protein
MGNEPLLIGDLILCEILQGARTEGRDRPLWNAIVSNGGQESMCGWCKDRWGFSWQITPRALLAATQDPDLLFLPTRDNRPVSLRQFVHLLYVIV